MKFCPGSAGAARAKCFIRNSSGVSLESAECGRIGERTKTRTDCGYYPGHRGGKATIEKHLGREPTIIDPYAKSKFQKTNEPKLLCLIGALSITCCSAAFQLRGPEEQCGSVNQHASPRFLLSATENRAWSTMNFILLGSLSQPCCLLLNEPAGQSRKDLFRTFVERKVTSPRNDLNISASVQNVSYSALRGDVFVTQQDLSIGELW